MPEYFNKQFYCTTIAYHVGLNANSGGRTILANNQEKWTFGFGRVRGLVCTIAVLFDNSSFFSCWPTYWKVFEILLKIFTIFSEYTYCWMFFLLFNSFYYIDISDITFIFTG